MACYILPALFYRYLLKKKRECFGHSASPGILINAAFCILSPMDRLNNTIQLSSPEAFLKLITLSAYTTVHVRLRARSFLRILNQVEYKAHTNASPCIETASSFPLQSCTDVVLLLLFFYIVPSKVFLLGLKAFQWLPGSSVVLFVSILSLGVDVQSLRGSLRAPCAFLP